MAGHRLSKRNAVRKSFGMATEDAVEDVQPLNQKTGRHIFNSLNLGAGVPGAAQRSIDDVNLNTVQLQ